jgi:alpha-L-arabinofuranosidase
LKLVNIQEIPQMLQIHLQGISGVRKEAAGEVITGALSDVNTVNEPMKIVPKPVMIKDAGTDFVHELPAHSVSVIRLKTK